MAANVDLAVVLADGEYLKRSGAALVGDIPAAGGTPADGSITNAKLANVPTATVKGRVNAATGVPADLTTTQLTTLVNTFTAALKGAVPPPTTATGKYLKDDGTWATPAGGGGGLPPDATYTDIVVSGTGTVWNIVAGAVGTTEIVDGAITTNKIGALQITAGKIYDDSIDTRHYVDGSINTVHIADAQITAAKLAPRTITTYSATATTAVIGNANCYLVFTGTNPTYTVPLNATVAFPVGTQIDGAGTATAMTVVAAGGVTIVKARTLVTVGAGSGWTLIKTATDTWHCHGDFV